jgi:hypothetical protein
MEPVKPDVALTTFESGTVNAGKATYDLNAKAS